MDIPTEIIQRINPEIKDPVSQSVIYTFNSKSYRYNEDGNMLYKFPYSQDTFWTHFKVLNSDGYMLAVEVILITSDGYTYTISQQQLREKGRWYDTTWPFPSINTSFEAGVYLKIKPHNIDMNLSIKLLGFMYLFPKVDNYLLLSSLDTYQFVFSKHSEENRGVIYNVENYCYIKDIINKSCGIRMLNRY